MSMPKSNHSESSDHRAERSQSDQHHGPDETTVQRRRAWAYLGHVFEGPHRYLDALWQLDPQLDPRDLAERIAARDTGLSQPLLTATEARYRSADPDADLQAGARVGARLVTRDDNEWPTTALDTAFDNFGSVVSSKSEQTDACRPTCLWVKGHNLSHLTHRTITIVGTRSASSYGHAVAGQFATELGARGYTVISGGALGIDTAAHLGALNAAAPTIAVTACGIDVDYPASNRHLFQRIAQNGAIVTEYPPGRRPARHRFLTRNRLAAALGGATIVVEAGFRSGALNTANWCEHMNLPLLAVPGSVLSRESCGCHRLIREGSAILVERAEDVIEALSPVGSLNAEALLEREFPKSESSRLTRDQLRVYDATAPTGSEVMHICDQAAIPLAITMRILFDLAQLGLVERRGQRYFRRH